MEVLQEQIIVNHDSMMKWHNTKKKKYDKSREDLLSEKLTWEKDQERIQRASNKGSDVINLNIGGTDELMTSKDVLTSDKGS